VIADVVVSLPLGKESGIDTWQDRTSGKGDYSPLDPSRPQRIFESEGWAMQWECTAILHRDLRAPAVLFEKNGNGQLPWQDLGWRNLMEYHEPEPITRRAAQEAFAGGDARRIADALVAVTFSDPDWRWVQGECLVLLDHPSDEVRGLAATCLGHLARIHGQLDRRPVLAALCEHRDDPVIGGRVEDALDDIATYLRG
jgi:hypothetical protein